MLHRIVLVAMILALGATSAPAQNTAPTISSIADQTAEQGVASAAFAFTVDDAQTAAGNLLVLANSSNQALVPDSGIVLGGSGADRTITITPAANQTGACVITVTVSDGQLSASSAFNLVVTLPSQLFIAYLHPQPSAITTASGSATLRLAGDEQSATIFVQYNNLSSPKASMHISGPADPNTNGSAGIIFDMDIPPQGDGSYLWVFPTDATQRQQTVGWIKNGQTYLNVNTSNYPNGEIKGFFSPADGSITFTKPAPVPAASPGPPTANEAARFLTQATFGPTEQDITDLQHMYLTTWIQAQMQEPPTYLKPLLDERKANGDSIGLNEFDDAWWFAALRGRDQLRQRVAFALSEIMVVSQQHAVLQSQPYCLASYYDTLLRDAFGNFRTLLQDVTLHPAMGVYLDMLGNKKADPDLGTNPNENYAREVNQLFTIGLQQLWPDGSIKLDEYGLPIPTYNQDVVMGFARVFTGWNFHQTANPPSLNPAPNYLLPMTLIPANHEQGLMPGQTYSKLLLNGVTLPPGQTGDQDLAAVLDNILNHPNLGPFISKQLIQHLVTSNPSRGYIYRVSRVFDGYRRGDRDGSPSGVRGDLGAVVTAILMDYEARDPSFITQSGYGKVREPLLRNTAIIRAFNPTSKSGYWKMNQTDGELGQTPLRSPTVFNFFEPGYVQPGVIAKAGLLSPEFQITNDATVINCANFMRDGIYNGWKSGVRDIRISFDRERAVASGTTPQALIDRVNLLLMAGQMPPAMQSRIMTELKTTTNTLTRAQAAIHLTATSAQFAVQR
jgi:uncharacterized protein (DUF1800 family)